MLGQMKPNPTVKPDPCCSWQGSSWWVGADVVDESMESSSVLQPLRIPSVILSNEFRFCLLDSFAISFIIILRSIYWDWLNVSTFFRNIVFSSSNIYYHSTYCRAISTWFLHSIHGCISVSRNVSVVIRLKPILVRAWRLASNLFDVKASNHSKESPYQCRSELCFNSVHGSGLSRASVMARHVSQGWKLCRKGPIDQP